MEEKTLTGYPSIDKPWLKYFDEAAIAQKLPEGSMYDYLYERNKSYLDQEALHYLGTSISYRKLFVEIESCAQSLIAAGVKSGDVVSLCMLAVPETVYLLYAINKIGAISNFIVVNATAEQMHKQIALTNCKIVFTMNVFREAIITACNDTSVETIISVSTAQSIKGLLGFIGRTKDNVNWKTFRKEAAKYDYTSQNANDTAVIIYTGGTTGEHKGVVISNEAANAIVMNYFCASKCLEFQRQEIFLDIIPPFLAYGLFFALHMPLCLGLRTILSPDPSPEAFSYAMRKYHPNHFSCGWTHIDYFINDKKTAKMDMSFLKTVSYGGDSMSDEWEHKVNLHLKSHGCLFKLLKGYGLTETASAFCADLHYTPGMIPFINNNIRIIDTETKEELNYGVEGEVLVSGPTLMKGYYKNSSDEVFEKIDGVLWLKTGDLGFINPDGTFVLSGRIKRIFWHMGDDNIAMRVYPMAIEKVICEDEDVKQCTVVGKKDGKSGYLPIAYIIANQPIADDTLKIKERIHKRCLHSLPENAVPKEYNFLEEMPLTGAGKVDFRKLEEKANG